MDLDLSPYLNPEYQSPSQRTRVVSEPWVAHEFYCASCGSSLTPYRANTPVYDFYSESCGEKFQLKASKSPIKSKATGAKFDKLWHSILSNSQPSLVLLHYDRPKWRVRDLTLIHRACITKSCIRRRKPLSDRAERAGWEGCDILLKDIPELGKIPVVTEGKVRDKVLVLGQWKQSSKLLGANPLERGWLSDILRCVERLYVDFRVSDVYSFEEELARLHPDNRHVKDKIRQQLQRLRDMGILKPISRGEYRYLGRQKEP